jgi:HEAT repeat protein
LLADEKPSVRQAVAPALGRLGGPAAAAALVAFLRSPDDDDRRLAVWGLGSIREEAAVLGLVSCLEDSSRYVRAEAARFLVPLDDPDANRAILQAARRGDAGVAREAWRLLIATGDEATESALVAAIDFESVPEMVHAYLASGNPRLAKAARDSREGQRAPKIGEYETPRWGQRSRS